MKPIFLIGKNGQLGWELHRALISLGEVTALDAPDIDICDRDGLRRALYAIRPGVIINASAYTAVDQAENEPETAMAVNAGGPGFLASLAAEMGAAFIHYSTDYVFDGKKGSPYVESDPPAPLGVYAASKLAGEQAVAAAGGAYLLLRTSWLYSLRRASFVTKVLEWSRKQTVMHVVSDQVSNPTWARTLAQITALALAQGHPDVFGWLRERRGVYHLAGDGYASRLEWAQAVLENDPQPEEQHVRELLPALTSDFPTPAERPLFSALDCSRFTGVFGLRLPEWRAALKLAMRT
jgi:dTDP-4-dehydrorhamnose reductase